MKGLTAVYAIAPRVLTVAVFATAIVVGSLLSAPEVMMRTALSTTGPVGPIHYDEVVDQRNLTVRKLLAEDRDVRNSQPSQFLPAAFYGQVSPGDRIPITLSPGKLDLLDVTDVRELGKLIIPGSDQAVAKDYLLLIGQVVGQSDSDPVRLIVDANAKPPFDAQSSNDRRSL